MWKDIERASGYMSNGYTKRRGYARDTRDNGYKADYSGSGLPENHTSAVTAQEKAGIESLGLNTRGNPAPKTRFNLVSSRLSTMSPIAEGRLLSK